jgi:hypothetical protein
MQSRGNAKRSERFGARAQSLIKIKNYHSFLTQFAFAFAVEYAIIGAK